MKDKRVLIIIGLLILLIGCSNSKFQNSDRCLPGSIFFIRIGVEINHVPHKLLIRTDKKDSTYLKYTGHDQKHFNKYNFVISDWGFKNGYVWFDEVDREQYHLIKKFITSDTLHLITLDSWGGGEAVEIILDDKCDSQIFVVEKKNFDFFLQLQKLIEDYKNVDLKEHLDYFR